QTPDSVAIRLRTRLAYLFVQRCRRHERESRRFAIMGNGTGSVEIQRRKNYAVERIRNPTVREGDKTKPQRKRLKLMPVTISIPTALRQFAGGQTEIHLNAATAREALEQLTTTHTVLRRHLF